MLNENERSVMLMAKEEIKGLRQQLEVSHARIDTFEKCFAMSQMNRSDRFNGAMEKSKLDPVWELEMALELDEKSKEADRISQKVEPNLDDAVLRKGNGISENGGPIEELAREIAQNPSAWGITAISSAVRNLFTHLNTGGKVATSRRN